jgi:2-polyprenyl-3-methyl-5-hydroxy-6-metoxy-1,4-benzoquinol methylase
MQCKICGSSSEKLFSSLTLHKYQVDYFKCSSCGFIQTEEPYWLEEAYSSAITSLDIGLIDRNLQLLPVTQSIVKLFYHTAKKFIDYGGGYGMFVRMMRDKGFDFYRQDLYCDNLFAKGFDVSDLAAKHTFELLTAFEVFEHLVDPAGEVEKMLEYSPDIFFTTSIYPEGQDLKEWWYLTPETGQHIALYSHKALAHLAEKNGMYYYTAHNTYHLFSKHKISAKLFSYAFRPKFQLVLNKVKPNPASLLQKDYNHISSINM